jgi:hypothetical protein
MDVLVLYEEADMISKQCRCFIRNMKGRVSLPNEEVEEGTLVLERDD